MSAHCAGMCVSATFRVKNFERFQHYKDRSPPWIKLYNELLDDYDFACLQDASKLHLIMIWLLASRSDNTLPYDPAWIAKRINATSEVNLDALADAGFIVLNQVLQQMEQVDSTLLAPCQQNARPERETETEVETERKTAEAVVVVEKEYAFNGTVLKLSQKHFDNWAKAYSNISLLAELTARDAWLASDRATNDDRKNWFISTSKYLANRSTEVCAEAQPPPIKRTVDGRL